MSYENKKTVSVTQPQSINGVITTVMITIIGIIIIKQTGRLIKMLIVD